MLSEQNLCGSALKTVAAELLMFGLYEHTKVCKDFMYMISYRINLLLDNANLSKLIIVFPNHRS